MHTILIVDDDPSMLGLLRINFIRIRINVVTAK